MGVTYGGDGVAGGDGEDVGAGDDACAGDLEPRFDVVDDLESPQRIAVGERCLLAGEIPGDVVVQQNRRITTLFATELIRINAEKLIDREEEEQADVLERSSRGSEAGAGKRRREDRRPLQLSRRHR